MSLTGWDVYSATEDDHIEYIRCMERLQSAGLSEEDAELMALKCDVCCFSRMCSVTRESIFLGAKTC